MALTPVDGVIKYASEVFRPVHDKWLRPKLGELFLGDWFFRDLPQKFNEPALHRSTFVCRQFIKSHLSLPLDLTSAIGRAARTIVDVPFTFVVGASLLYIPLFMHVM